MKNKMKRFGALVGVILLAGSIIATLVMAILGFTFESTIFMGLVVADICLPILLWVYIWLFGKLTGKHTMASFDLMQDKNE
jgi:uncharacterized membrane protein YeaQ/YmgE (transglycosylase-associated protein family)